MDSSGDESRCIVGNFWNLQCRKKECVTFDSLSDENKELLQWRTGLNSFLPDSKLCQTHYDAYIKWYANNQKVCFDPNSQHKTHITKCLREVTIDIAKQLKTKLNVNVAPGMKYCDSCRKSLQQNLNEFDQRNENAKSAQDSSDPDSQNWSQASNYSNTDSQVCKDQIADIFNQLNLDRINFDGTRSESKAPYLKRKIQEVTDVMCKKMKTAYHLTEDIDCSLSDIKEKALCFDVIMERIKLAIKSCNYATKLQLLTLVPNLEQKKTCEYLEITRYTAAAACKLKEKKGVYSVPDKKSGSRELPEEVKQKVMSFYCDETSGNSKTLPGKKDCVSVGKKIYKQRQLLLLNLRELYATFKTAHPNIEIGFSTFCTLRPKWCVLAGSPGTHSICVCTIHQNVELQLHAIGSRFTLKDVMSLLVCDLKNKECMLRECTTCPTEEKITQILRDMFDRRSGIASSSAGANFEEEDDSQDEDSVIQFKQWVSTDRTELITRSLYKSEFFDNLSSAFQKLLPHAYTTTEQFKHIQKLKDSLEDDACVILMDFSENYNFIAQDQAQAYYWTKNSCTVHPAVIYYKQENKLEHQSLCYLSDDLKHDTTIVHAFQDQIIDYLKKNLPHVRRVHYFSDGCPGQYKNCNNFLYLCEHVTKYELSATWSFFATSHGMSPCDGIGGTIKREATNESLRRPYDEQILSVEKLLEFCKQRIRNIQCEIVWKKDVDALRNKETVKAFTIPGTRNFHEFVPLNNHIVKCKKVSTDPEYCLAFDLINKKKV